MALRIKFFFWGFSAAALICSNPARAQHSPPKPVFISPPFRPAVSAGDDIDLEAVIQSADAPVTNVEFYVNGALLSQDSSPPYATSLLSITNGVYRLMAVATDALSARGTSAVWGFFVDPPVPKSLLWSPLGGTNTDWNTNLFNWIVTNSPVVPAPFSLFHSGDTVYLDNTNQVFIGAKGIPRDVAPAAIMLSGDQTIQGGDILTGSINVKGKATFSNYTHSLSFPGGTILSSSTLYFDLSSVADGSVIHFGTGPITMIGAGLSLRSKQDQVAIMDNDFIVRSNCSLGLGAGPSTLTRFTGQLTLAGNLNVSLLNGGTDGHPRIEPDTWAGPIVLDQKVNQNNLHLMRIYVAFASRGFLISGGISDGAGDAANKLVLSVYDTPLLRLSGSNTYSHGTVIGGGGSSPPGIVEVSPESSLGTGDVEVDYSSPLHLMGDHNISSNALLTINSGSGPIILDPGVKIRLRTLRLGANTFSNGLFSATNSFGYLRSNGTIRLPSTNLPPIIVLTSPLPGTLLSPGDPVQMQALASDLDSYIDRVEFKLNGALIGVSSNAPYTLSISNPPAGSHSVQAVAYDDDGGSTISAPVEITVSPRLDRIEALPSQRFVLQFDSPINRACILQASDQLPALQWTDLETFPGGPTSRSVRFTNSLPAGATQRFFRLLMP